MKIGGLLLFDVFVVPNFDDPEELYLWRLRILDHKRFGIYLQRMDGPDSLPALHNHPFSFLSIVLWGWYWERLDYAGTERLIRWWNFKRYKTDFHWIDRLGRRPVWTLMIRGRRHGPWGFKEPDGQVIKWKRHRNYQLLVQAMAWRAERGL